MSMTLEIPNPDIKRGISAYVMQVRGRLTQIFFFFDNGCVTNQYALGSQESLKYVRFKSNLEQFNL
jgi:hypothetical protein